MDPSIDLLNEAAPVTLEQRVGGLVRLGRATQYGVQGAFVQNNVKGIRWNVRHRSA